MQQRPPYREHPPGRHPSDRPADQDWPPHPHEQAGRMPLARRPQQQWSPSREHDWPPPDHHGHSPTREWSQKRYPYAEGPEAPSIERSHDPHNSNKRSDTVPQSSDSDASVHEAVAQLAEQMKSVKGLASKLNLPNSPKTAKEWQEVAKMVAAAATGGGSQEQGEDDTQKRVAAMLANDSDSDTENPTEVRRPSPAREFDGTYSIPPEFCKPVEEERYSTDYGHGEVQFGHRPYDYPPDEPYHHDHPPSFCDSREHERFPHGRPYHRPLSPPPPHRHQLPPPPDYKGFPPSHAGDWHDGGRPRTPPYPQYGPPLPHEIPSSMLDEMTSDQQLLLAAAVNSGSGKTQ